MICRHTGQGNLLLTSVTPVSFLINLGIGIAFRYINSNLASGQSASGSTYKTGNSVAGDLTLFHDGTVGSSNGSGLNWGITLSNLGAKISYTNDASEKDFIPANLGLGVAYVKSVDESNKVTFGLDINKLLVPTPPAVGDTAGLGRLSQQRRGKQLV